MKHTKKYNKVFVAGVFDHFHVGHQFFLYQAMELAENIVIVIARDKNVKNKKSFFPDNDEQKRLQRIKEEQLPHSFVRLGREDSDFFKTLEEEMPDILLLGYDQFFDEKECTKRFPHLIIQKAKPYHPHIFKSSQFKKNKK